MGEYSGKVIFPYLLTVSEKLVLFCNTNTQLFMLYKRFNDLLLHL